MQLETIATPEPSLSPVSEQSFPRIIHHTWKRPQLSRPLRRCVESFHKLNPGWEMRFYTDTDCEKFVRDFHPDFLDTYLSYPAGILRADIFRVLVLWSVGGVYADIDVECRRPLDDLLAAVGRSEWEVLLTTDHPIHERVHYGDRRMWMNDFMVARPRARFFSKAIEAFRHRAFHGYRPEDAVQITGPGLFTTLIEEAGGPEAAGVTTLPWEWIHILPDMTLNFVEHPRFERAIVRRIWHDQHQPFAVHYWYHTWSKGLNTLTKYEDIILQSDGEIVELRLQSELPLLGPRASTTGRALAEFAERGRHTLLELHSPRDPEDRSHRFENTFREVAARVLRNLNRRHLGAGISADGENDLTDRLSRLPTDGLNGNQPLFEWYRQSPAEFLTTWGEQVGLVYLAGDARTDDEAKAQAELASLLLKRELILPGGCVLIENHLSKDGQVPFSKYARRAFEDAGFLILEEGDQLLLQRPNFPIPKVVHVISPTDNAPLPTALKRWLQLQQMAGWTTQTWGEKELIEFLEHHEADLVDLYTSWKGKRSRYLMAAMLVLKHKGGVYVDGRMLPQAPLEELVWGKRLVAFGVPRSEGSSDANAGSAISESLLASIPNHPFWNGLEHDLIRRRNAHSGKANLDGDYLTDRVWTSLRFLPTGDIPHVVALASDAGPASFDVPSSTTQGRLPLFSKLCSEYDFQAKWFHEATTALGEGLRYHRKLWENCFIFQALLERGFAQGSGRGLAMLSESDSVTPALSQRTGELLVMDLKSFSRGHSSHHERAQRFAGLQLAQRMPSRLAVLNYETPDLAMLDFAMAGKVNFLFSGSALRHCKSVASTIVFLEKVLNLLLPGGVAVFTFDFDLSLELAPSPAGEAMPVMMFRAADLEMIRIALAKSGWQVTLDLRVGEGEVESRVDLPPYKDGPHLRLQIGDTAVTSGGLIIEDARTPKVPSSTL